VEGREGGREGGKGRRREERKEGRMCDSFEWKELEGNVLWE